MALCFCQNLPASIEFTPLADDRYVAACRHDHPLARKDAPKLAGVF
ncbi:hypothetical protein LNP74_28255 [Klebsiella pneumoniae subsp. pneumoniae]|nr:hypothetical protein [Klebsiella pneumoniae subsp. pneumoniae]